MSPNLSVLLVDDEPIVLKRLKPALEKSGYYVETFEDGRSAMQRLEEKDFDIVVTDVRMPHLDGIELLEKVNSRAKKIKVILITGYATIEVAREALVKGAFDFIAKPFKPNDLREVITKAARSLENEHPDK
jgi:DNA-binding NtrC family response regulator